MDEWLAVVAAETLLTQDAGSQDGQIDNQTKLEFAELLRQLRTTKSAAESRKIVAEMKRKVAEATKA
jgi:hypothetical protein